MGGGWDVCWILFYVVVINVEGKYWNQMSPVGEGVAQYKSHIGREGGWVEG